MTTREIAHADCPVCSNGLLVFMVQSESGRLFLECEECMTGYWGAPTLDDSFRTEEAEWPSRPATKSEVEHVDWAVLLAGEQS